MSIVLCAGLAACGEKSATTSTPTGASPPAGGQPAPPPAPPTANTQPTPSPGSQAPNKAAEGASPKTSGPGNTSQVQESAAHGATQTTEEKKK